MTMCANVDVFNTEIETFIKQYETALEDDTLSDVDSADTKEALESLYSYRKAIQNEDLEYINAQGKDAVNTVTKQEIMESTFERVLGKYFMFSNGNSNNSVMGTLVSAVPSGAKVKLTYKEKGIEKQHTFSTTSGSRSTSNKKKRFINVPKFGDFVGEYNIALEQHEQDNLVLGSGDNKVKLGEKYKETSYVHGNLKHMKDMLKRLHILGGEKAKDADLDTYLSYMDKMSPEFFNKLELYLEEAGNNSQGVARAKRMDIVIDPSEKVAGNQQSEASIFMEEVVHTMTASAINSKVPQAIKLKRQLATLIEQARKKVTWKDFLPSDAESIDAVQEEKYARWLYNYIFTGKNADYEFIAKALAVPEVSQAFAKIKVKDNSEDKSILTRINDFFGTIIDILSGSLTLAQNSQNVHDAVVNLAYSFGEINNRATRKISEEGSYLDKVFEVVNGMDDKINLFSKDVKDKVFGNIANIPESEGSTTLYGRVKDTAKFIGLSLVNPVHTKAMGVVASAYGVKPEGTIREIIGGMFATDSAQKVAEFLSMQSGYVDKQRNDQVDLVRKNILHKFKSPKDVSPELEEALTSVIADTELSYLFGNDSIAKDVNIRKTVYTNRTLRKLLTDDEHLEKLIDGAKKALKEIDREHYFWHVNQSVGLGVYMATHRGTPEQNLNAYNIARGIHSSHEKRSTPQLEKAINELSTLVAIKNTDINDRNLVATAMTSEWAGVQHVADVVEGFKKNTDATVFKGRKTNKIKGYSREIFDDSIVVEIAPLEDQKRMEADGFTLKSKLQNRAGESRVKPMALYVTDSATRVNRLRGGVRLNQITSKGSTITSTAYKDGSGTSTAVVRERAKRDIARIQREASIRAKQMETGDYDFKNTIFGVVPVLNDEGNVVDYRYMMDKATKKEMLKQDTKVSEVMAKSFGSLVDKEKSVSHNEEALNELKKEMLENWEGGSKGKDGKTEYSLIGPNATDPEMKKLYYMLPHEYQTFINNRSDKTLAVRRDLLFLYFGYSNMTIANFPGLNKITPKVVMKFIKIAEMLWVEMVKIVKTNILIKMPTVLLGNIFSNMLYSTLRGYNPFTVAKMYVESYRNIKTYNKNVRRLQELENNSRDTSISISRDNLSAARKVELSAKLRRINGEKEALQRRVKDSPINELVLLGLDQNVEDSANDSERSSNRIVTAIDDKVLSHMPEMVKSGLDIMFITRRTKFYKVANEFLEVSDLIARDVQNQLEQKEEVKQADNKKILPSWWLEKKGPDYASKQRLTGNERKEFLAEAKKQRHYELVEDYVTYTKPSGRFEEYLNRIGVLMFTKYVKRIQRIIMKTGTKSPAKTIAVALLLGYLGGLPSILDQSIMAKDWYTDSIGAGNVFPVYNLGEHLINAYTPSIVKSSTYDFSL